MVGTSQRMTLILRAMKKHMGWEDAKDDYVVLDGGRSVGRIHKDTTSPRRIWSVNTSPYPAPPPNNGLAPTLEEAKQQEQFKRFAKLCAGGERGEMFVFDWHRR
jgi:hypothetical protein